MLVNQKIKLKILPVNNILKSSLESHTMIDTYSQHFVGLGSNKGVQSFRTRQRIKTKIKTLALKEMTLSPTIITASEEIKTILLLSHVINCLFFILQCSCTSNMFLSLIIIVILLLLTLSGIKLQQICWDRWVKCVQNL